MTVKNTIKNGTIIQSLEQQQMKKDLPKFRPGDTVIVKVEVTEGTKVRQQAFEGIVIAIKRPAGINASFTVRKISYGEGVNRVFQTHSPLIKSIEVKRKGKVRKAKLYYLEHKSGKQSRIQERLTSNKVKED